MQIMTQLKSLSEPLPTQYAPSISALPPRDGANLQAVYDAETDYLRQMRAGNAPAQWYDWVPETSLSVSKREAAKLEELAEFPDEPVAIRGTGGTAVPQGPGTINLSVFSHHPRHPGIRETYGALCQALIQGFDALGLETTIGARSGSFCDGDYNILLNGQKLVGTAQRWAMRTDGSAICLHHCVILDCEDPDSLCRRTEALYAACEQPVRYDRTAHAALRLDRADLVAAMDKPLRDYIVKAKGDRL